MYNSTAVSDYDGSKAIEACGDGSAADWYSCDFHHNGSARGNIRCECKGRGRCECVGAEGGSCVGVVSNRYTPCTAA